MIVVEGLTKRFGRHQALAGVDFAVPRGEIFGFLGPNGAGKTTTIRVLSTLVRPDSGLATVAGIRVDEDPYAVQRALGYMPDFFGVYDRLTALEYLEFFAACHEIPARQGHRVAKELLELVNLSDRADSQVDTLSRGMKQRLCLARALVHGPQVLLLDEPASGLDPRARVEMRDLIRELRSMEKTILVSSHIIPEMEELCTWVGVIDRGRMVAVGPKAQVLSQVAASNRTRMSFLDPQRAEAARQKLEGQSGVLSAKVGEDGLEVETADGFPIHTLLRDLVQSGFDVTAFTPLPGSLSDVVLRLTGNEEEGVA